jgi:actin, other eukaryote
MEGGSFEYCLVVDNGTYAIKAGINGNDSPTHTFMNLVGQPFHDGIPGTAEHTESCKIGSQIIDPSLYRLERPMERGVVRDWDLMSQVWNHMFYNELRLVPDEHAVFMTEIILAPKRNREKAAEILFETFNVPALQFASPLLLGMYSIGKTTGVSIDIGEGYSSVTPIYDGFVL